MPSRAHGPEPCASAYSATRALPATTEVTTNDPTLYRAPASQEESMQILTKITLSMVAAPLCTFLVEAGTKVGPIGRGAR